MPDSIHQFPVKAVRDAMSGPKNVFSGYSFDAGNPAVYPTPAVSLIHEAAEIRGWCTQSFTQAEFILAYFVHRASKTFPEYAHFVLPYRTDNRPKRVREMLGLDGPLKKHASEVEKLLNLLADFEDFRHILVHGWSDIVDAPNGLFLRYRLYEPTPSNPWAIRITTTTIETLREHRDQLVAFAAGAVILFSRIFLLHGLEDDTDDDVFVPQKPG